MKKEKATANQFLRRERELRGWSQCYVAEQIDAPTSSYIHRWEKGLVLPSPYYRERLCVLFQKNAAELGFLIAPASDLSSVVQADFALASRTSAPPWQVPYRRNPFFTDRDEILNDLYTTFFGGKRSVLSQVQALSGLGGIGKTQTAIEYAYRYRDTYSTVLWLQAQTQDDLNSSCIALKDLLNLSRCEEYVENAIDLLRIWLSNHENWLLILDNIEDLTLLYTVLPVDCYGHTLLTTRTQFTGGFARCIQLDKMKGPEGTLLLLRRAKQIELDLALEQIDLARYPAAQELASLLDGLPLALDQAGSYIEETGCSTEEYLDHYRKRRLELLDRRGGSGLEHPHSVNAMFSLAFERLEQQHTFAAELLRLCVFFYPHAIPQELITGGGNLNPRLQSMTTDALLLDEALRVLRSLSLIRRNAENMSFDIHVMIQIIFRERYSQTEQRHVAKLVVRLVSQAFPNPEDADTWQCCQRYIRQALTCVVYIEQWNIVSPEAAHLLFRVAIYAWKYGSSRLAERLLKKFLAIRIYLQGVEHGTDDLDKSTPCYYQSWHWQTERLFLQSMHKELKIPT
ncbi:XRE family transcriptional regulator [Reticulibacter mediterranei]|uniref:XRE family transcriptional regulator n=1 Tax=Reticulibacter mediterranei TaxID=2778369 RepID=UPI001C6894FC|nr:XRE family transcriptional regulator [Reticulibacter mediterranei]